MGYICALNYIGQTIPEIGRGWTYGLWTPGKGPWPIPQTNGEKYIVLGNVNGVIFYWIPKRKLKNNRTWEKIKAKARSFPANLNIVRELDWIVVRDVAAVTLGTAVVIGAGWYTGKILTELFSTAMYTGRYAH
jgi:hypothetical protein